MFRSEAGEGGCTTSSLVARCFTCGDVTPLSVPATRACYPLSDNVKNALLDLRNEGLDNLDAIAADYSINPLLLLRLYHENRR